ncbi:MAG: hypothetical protein ABI131_03790, partial [Nostocoides sp.]
MNRVAAAAAAVVRATCCPSMLIWFCGSDLVTDGRGATNVVGLVVAGGGEPAVLPRGDEAVSVVGGAGLGGAAGGGAAAAAAVAVTVAVGVGPAEHPAMTTTITATTITAAVAAVVSTAVAVVFRVMTRAVRVVMMRPPHRPVRWRRSGRR